MLFFKLFFDASKPSTNCQFVIVLEKILVGSLLLQFFWWANSHSYCVRSFSILSQWKICDVHVWRDLCLASKLNLIFSCGTHSFSELQLIGTALKKILYSRVSWTNQVIKALTGYSQRSYGAEPWNCRCSFIECIKIYIDPSLQSDCLSWLHCFVVQLICSCALGGWLNAECHPYL